MPKLTKRITKRDGKPDSASYSVTIPIEYIKKFGWKKGEDIEVSLLTSHSLKLQSLDDLVSPDYDKASYGERRDQTEREEIGRQKTLKD